MSFSDLQLASTMGIAQGTHIAYAETLRRLRASGVGKRHLLWLEAAVKLAKERIDADQAECAALWDRARRRGQ